MRRSADCYLMAASQQHFQARRQHTYATLHIFVHLWMVNAAQQRLAALGNIYLRVELNWQICVIV